MRSTLAERKGSPPDAHHPGQITWHLAALPKTLREEAFMQRALSYQLPFERLAKLSRTASRKGYPTVWWLTWLWIVLFLVAIVSIAVGADNIRAVFDPLDEGPLIIMLAATLIFAVGGYLLRRLRIAAVKRRATFNETIRLTQDEGGLRFATEEVEHYLKWRGISQLLLEPDGVVVSHGNLFFLVPDHAFPSAGERVAFIRDVYSRLGERARSISNRHVSAVLGGVTFPAKPESA
jgi:hypothetical protein